jgi:hypothetical protein
MTHLDRLSILNAGGLSILLGGAISSLNGDKISSVVASAGLGLVASTISGMYQYEDRFEGLREEFNRRERLYHRK